jgi:anti-sigma B factor antagonist
MRIEEQNEAGVTVLSVMDARIDARVAPEFKRLVAEVIDRGASIIALDMSKVEFVDSSGLGAIVTLLKLIGRTGDLSIAGAREAVLDLFRLTRMDKVFHLYPTTQAAVAALSR